MQLALEQRKKCRRKPVGLVLVVWELTASMAQIMETVLMDATKSVINKARVLVLKPAFRKLLPIDSKNIDSKPLQVP
jgi:hypothetical protein